MKRGKKWWRRLLGWGVVSAVLTGCAMAGLGYEEVITLRAEEPYRFCTDVPFGYPAGAVEAQPDPAVRDAGERVVRVRYHVTPAL
jgi:hypothetical protein